MSGDCDMNVEQKLSIMSSVFAVRRFHQAVADWPPGYLDDVSRSRSRWPGARGRRKKRKAQKVARRLNR